MNRIVLTLIVTGIVIVAILLTAAKEEPSMSPPANGQTETSLPPLDLDADTKTETATFAMG